MAKWNLSDSTKQRVEELLRDRGEASRDSRAILANAKRAEQSVVVVRNDSGADVPRFGVLGLNDIMVPRASSEELFSNRLAFSGYTPTANAHEGQFAVMLNATPAGSTGYGVIGGAVQCQVDIQDEDHQFAGIADGDNTQLRSYFHGSARILWKEDGTSTKWAVVQLQRAREVYQYFPVTFEQTGGAAGSFQTGASWLYTVRDFAGLELGTDIDPTATPHTYERTAIGPLGAATYGIAYYQPKAGDDLELVIEWCNETFDLTFCKHPDYDPIAVGEQPPGVTDWTVENVAALPANAWERAILLWSNGWMYEDAAEDINPWVLFDPFYPLQTDPTQLAFSEGASSTYYKGWMYYDPVVGKIRPVVRVPTGFTDTNGYYRVTDGTTTAEGGDDGVLEFETATGLGADKLAVEFTVNDNGGDPNNAKVTGKVDASGLDTGYGEGGGWDVEEYIKVDKNANMGVYGTNETTLDLITNAENATIEYVAIQTTRGPGGSDTNTYPTTANSLFFASGGIQLLHANSEDATSDLIDSGTFGSLFGISCRIRMNDDGAGNGTMQLVMSGTGDGSNNTYVYVAARKTGASITSVTRTYT